MHGIMRSILRATQYPIALDGRAQKVILATSDALFGPPPQAVDTVFGSLVIDPGHPPQRLLACAFDNFLLHYERSALAKCIRERGVDGGVFLDIGANLGMYSLIASRAGFRTASFEPDADLFAFLSRNRSMFPHVSSVAVSAGNGCAAFHATPGKFGAQSLVPGPSGNASIVVRTASLDTALLELDLPPAEVSFIKIDVEGAEEAVIRGMAAFFQSGARPFIWCEVRGDTGGRASGSFRPVYDTLFALGYNAQTAEGEPFVPDCPPATVFDLAFYPCDGNQR